MENLNDLMPVILVIGAVLSSVAGSVVWLTNRMARVSQEAQVKLNRTLKELNEEFEATIARQDKTIVRLELRIDVLENEKREDMISGIVDGVITGIAEVVLDIRRQQ